MSTRGLIGFRRNGKEYLQYNHSDSYPEGLGIKVLQDMQGLPIQALHEYLEGVKQVGEEDLPTAHELQRLGQTHPHLVSRYYAALADGEQWTWYDLLWEYQGELGLQVTEKLPFFIDSDGFQYEGLFCEWGYIVNLDDAAVEIYTGHYQAAQNSERNRLPFREPAGRYCSNPRVPPVEDYRPVTLLESIPFEELRKIPRDAIAAYCRRFADQQY